MACKKVVASPATPTTNATTAMLPLQLGDGTADISKLAVPTQGVRVIDTHAIDPATGKPITHITGLASGDSYLITDFLSPSEADSVLAKLTATGDKAEIDYQQWYHMVNPNDPSSALEPLRRVKRAMAHPRDKDGAIPHYRFPVNDQERYGVQSPMSPTIEWLRQRVVARTGIAFNHSVVLLYRDGDDCIGFHRDKTLDLDDTSPIVSISLGAERTYAIRDSIYTSQRAQQWTLPHGTLLSLGPTSNNEWYHSLIPSSSATPTIPLSTSTVASSSATTEAKVHHTARVSITFRMAATYKDAVTGELMGKGAAHNDGNWPTELKGCHRFDNDVTTSLPPNLLSSITGMNTTTATLATNANKHAQQFPSVRHQKVTIVKTVEQSKADHAYRRALTIAARDAATGDGTTDDDSLSSQTFLLGFT